MRKKLADKTGNAEEYARVQKCIRKLLEISRVYRKQRMELGALELQSSEVRFEISDTKKPLNIQTKQSLEVMKMVEEYMVMANKYVAHRIYQYFPMASLLRRHPFPSSFFPSFSSFLSSFLPSLPPFLHSPSLPSPSLPSF